MNDTLKGEFGILARTSADAILRYLVQVNDSYVILFMPLDKPTTPQHLKNLATTPTGPILKEINRSGDLSEPSYPKVQSVGDIIMKMRLLSIVQHVAIAL